MSEFTVPNISISGAPTVDWVFAGAVGKATALGNGAKAYAELIDDQEAYLRVSDSDGKTLAEIHVHKLFTDESITVSLMNVGSALLWSHARWLESGAGHSPGHNPPAQPASDPADANSSSCAKGDSNPHGVTH